MRLRRILFVSLLAGTFPAFAFEQQSAPSLAETCPNLTAAERAAIDNYAGAFTENAIYARTYCVSVEEAERRMAIQARDAVGPKTEPGPLPPPPPDSIGAVSGAVQANEASIFAGLWIQNRPDYRVIVAFTRDAASTLAKYTKDPLFKPLDRPGPSLAELRGTQQKLTEALTRHGFRWSTAGAREDLGIVEIELAQDAAPVRAAAARGAFALPDWVVLTEPRPLPISAPPPPAPGAVRVTSFPQFAFRTDGYPRTLVGVPDVPTTLRLRNGCLVLEIAGETRTALWQASDALDLSDPARVSVLNRLSGTRVTAGDDIVLRGLQPGEERVPDHVVGTEECPGPYRVVNGFLSRAAWEAERRENGIARRVHELGSPAVAIADYEADQARLPSLRAWRDRMLAEHGDVVAAIWLNEDDGTGHLFHTAAPTRAGLVPAELMPFVTAQDVPVGRNVLESARMSLEPQLEAAGIAATLQAEPIGGEVLLRPTDARALSAAAVAGRIDFPERTRIVFDGAMALSDHEARSRRNPEDVWLWLEAAPDFAAIRALVEATELPVVEPPLPPGAAAAPALPAKRYARPGRAASLQSAQFLVAYGQSAREIAALKPRGFDPVDALDTMNGRPTSVTRALLARQVVLAELVELDPRDAGRDGFRSTARWRVVETLKGSARPGDVLNMRMVSGEEANGTLAQALDEPLILAGLPGSLEPGGRWLLHLNDALYAHNAFIHGGNGAARTDGTWYVSTGIPDPVEDGEVLAAFDGQKPYPLADLRGALAPLQAAMIASGLIEGTAR